MKKETLTALAITVLLPLNVMASDAVSDEVIAEQRAALETNTTGLGFGPQAPRDIDLTSGANEILFDTAPLASQMNLCNIHFHENAEHKGGEFTEYAGNGDGHGYGSGYKYVGELTTAELTATTEEICPSEDHGSLEPGATIEVHYVHSTSEVDPGPSLGACFNDAIGNPQLRVEAQVYVLVNDENALDFADLTAHDKTSGKNQVLNIPTNTGTAIQYEGSTTGPGYNEEGSPYQVSWSVRPQVAKVNIDSVGEWCKSNVFEEDHAHGVRNLVQNPKLLSEIN